MGMTPGIVIVTYRCRELALGCLESLEAHLPAALAHTIVVDNASNDGLPMAVRRRLPGVRVIENTRNAGFATAANAGMAELPDRDVICLLNPDSIVMDDGLQQIALYLGEHTGTGVAGARIENIDGTLQPSCREFPRHATALFNRHSLATKLVPWNRWSRRYLMTDWDHDEVQAVDWVSGACMLIHRRAIERVGLLDPGYFFSIEDVDYCRRVHDAGLSVEYVPLGVVRHRVGGSSRHAVYRAMRAHHQGMWRYYTQHMKRSRLLDIVTFAGIAARFGLHAASYTARLAWGRVTGNPPN